MVLENGQPHPVPVTVGMTAGDLTEVSGDLQEGDQVLVMTTTTTSTTDQPGDFGPARWRHGRPAAGWRLVGRRREASGSIRVIDWATALTRSNN